MLPPLRHMNPAKVDHLGFLSQLTTESTLLIYLAFPPPWHYRFYLQHKHDLDAQVQVAFLGEL